MLSFNAVPAYESAVSTTTLADASIADRTDPAVDAAIGAPMQGGPPR